MRKTTFLALNMLGIGLLAAQPALAAFDVWVDFDNRDPANNSGPQINTPLGILDSMDTSIFPGLNNTTDRTAVETKIVARLNTDYSGLGFNFTTTAPATFSYETVVIGNKVGDTSRLFGEADSIDWRNKNFGNVVGISLQAHFNYKLDNGSLSNGHFNSTNTNYTTTNLGDVLANTASHELAHVLGLVHGDVISTYAGAAGAAAAKAAAVQSGELMTKGPKDANFYSNALAFGAYSQLKLKVATQGVLLENETGTTQFTLPGSSDLGRSGDTGKSFATGTPVITGPLGVVSILGSLNNDTDYYKFYGRAGQVVNGEVLSQRISEVENDSLTHTPLFSDFITPGINLLDANGAILQAGDFPASNLDGSGNDNLEGDTIIYNYTLPADGFYAWQVGSLPNGDHVGNYELFTNVPEPGFCLLAVLAGALLARRR